MAAAVAVAPDVTEAVSAVKTLLAESATETPSAVAARSTGPVIAEDTTDALVAWVREVFPDDVRDVLTTSIVDHEIVETICNNRTAMVTYHSIPSATSTQVALFGVGTGIKASIKTWVLGAANNYGPQP